MSFPTFAEYMSEHYPKEWLDSNNLVTVSVVTDESTLDGLKHYCELMGCGIESLISKCIRASLDNLHSMHQIYCAAQDYESIEDAQHAAVEDDAYSVPGPEEDELIAEFNKLECRHNEAMRQDARNASRNDFIKDMEALIRKYTQEMEDAKPLIDEFFSDNTPDDQSPDMGLPATLYDPNAELCDSDYED